MADFETTTDPEDCRVWSWFLVDIDGSLTVDDVEVGTDLDSFVERISESSEVVYFHNLKFDGTFIIDWLFRNGYNHSQSALLPGEFSSLISAMGQFYSVTVYWENGKRTEFRDSLKKLPYSVAVIAKAFGLDMAKGEIDYHAKRPIGHKISAEEREYGCKDVLIPAHALKIQFDSGMKKLTVGSDALAEFKDLTTRKLFERLFPVLSDVIDHEIRQSYRGGWTIVAERFKGKRLGSGRVYDVNSLYPAVMRESLLPYGTPIFRGGAPVPDKDYPLFITSITFVATLKDKHVPCIQVKNNSRFSSTEYLVDIDEPTTMVLTNVDLDLWEKHYDLTILSYNGSWFFHGVTGLFNRYIDKWMEVKKNSTGGLRELAKLHLNSLYGLLR